MTGRTDLTADEDLDLRRDALVYALARLPDTSREVGIYGFETCQACGEIGTFYNFIGAMMHHGIWTRRDDAWKPSRGLFIAPDHGHRKMEPEEFTSSFCEICRLPTPRDRPHRVSHHVVCDRCQEALGKHLPEDLWRVALSQFVRERWRYHGIIERDEFWPESDFKRHIARSYPT